MNKVIHSILLSALTMSAAQAQLHSNRTYLRTRDSLSNNSAMVLMGQARSARGTQGKIGSTVSVTGFYRRSHNQTDIAQYFGGGQAVNNDQLGTIVVGAEQTVANNQLNDYVGYSNVTYGVDSAGTVNLKPVRTEYGAHINWQHDLGKVYKGLSLSVDLPIVYAQTTMGATTNVANLTKYFAGTYTATGDSAQSALSHMRMDNTKRSATELADAGINLSYAVRNQKASKLHTRLSLTIPTGSKQDGVYAFQPQVGNGGHFALGGGINWLTRLWHTNHCTQGLDLIADASYRYLFSTDQTRTMGIYNHWYNRLATAGHYRNLGKAAGTAAIPAANALTRTVTVTPGSEFSGLAALKYHYKNFNVFVGYNLYARDKEDVTLNNANQWFDGEYGILDTGHTLTTPVVVGADDVTLGGAIQKESNTTAITIDSAGAAVGDENAAQYYVTTDACASPSSVTHKLVGAAEMQFAKFRVPFSLSAGGEYEFTDKISNRGINSWAAWVKVSACF